ncbi:hypothetical protein HELRODRAFT_167612 [Helobdella robusta]|uniref:Methyltransferase domain-containing protein n=1 Tax=Helobdella robusta TaxID=6412 RepID=T1EZK1_HELRO|nr:hypothetical protein HELRODRAFT_167612 [Helobdella robusta]ESO11081.1 hypothetical protein HELRODRAFT_167612 [Helobdella robusta]
MEKKKEMPENGKRALRSRLDEGGLAGSNKFNSDLWRLNTLKFFREIFNEQNVTIDYLKIDIEGWEWESMDTAIKDGSLKKVKQIGIEFHRTGSITKSYYLEKLNFFSRLHNAGFRKWHTHLNVPCGTRLSDLTKRSIYMCHELYFINVFY